MGRRGASVAFLSLLAKLFYKSGLQILPENFSGCGLRDGSYELDAAVQTFVLRNL